jgi:hypothetical protein
MDYTFSMHRVKEREMANRISTGRILCVCLSLAFVAPLMAEGSFSAWTPGFGVRLFGLDLNFTSVAEDLLPLGKTELLAEFGGGYLSRGYYRLSRTERSDDPRGKLSCVDADMWLRGTQYLDKASRLRAALFLRAQSLSNLGSGAAEPGLLQASGLPEARGSFETGAGAAFGYTDMKRATASGQEIGWKADLSYEWSFELYPAGPERATVNEVALEFSGFLPLLDTDIVSLSLCEHILGSALLGLPPEHRLSSIGGNRYLPYAALGGLVRGVADNYGDGGYKVGDNLELRLEFPAVFKKIVIPGITLFADAGYAGYSGDDPGVFRTSAGAFATLRALGFVLGGGVVYEFTQGAFAPHIALGTQF